MSCFARFREKFKHRCKYYNVCLYMDKFSYTCENGGGSYCGMWQQLSKKQVDQDIEQAKEKLK